jgi:hypothetical protein
LAYGKEPDWAAVAGRARRERRSGLIAVVGIGGDCDELLAAARYLSAGSLGWRGGRMMVKRSGGGFWDNGAR